MTLNQTLPATGFITQDKYIRGRTLREIEQLLGFHARRLAQGMYVAVLQDIPEKYQFELQGYSQVAGHRFQKPQKLEIDKLKTLARSSWAWDGPNRLVKVFPVIRHNPNLKDDYQYPPGQGVPQWKLIAPVAARVVAFVDTYPNGRYQ